MKRYILLTLISVLTLSGCKLDEPRQNEVTKESLLKYASEQTVQKVSPAAFEAATCMYLEEFLTAGDDGKDEVNKKYGRESGWIKVGSTNEYIVSQYGRVKVQNGSFITLLSSEVERHWKRAEDGDTWISEDGFRASPIWDEEGNFSAVQIWAEGVSDVSHRLKSVMSFPSGPLTVSDPYTRRRTDYRYLVGDIRFDISHDGEPLDWIVIHFKSGYGYYGETSRD